MSTLPTDTHNERMSSLPSIAAGRGVDNADELHGRVDALMTALMDDATCERIAAEVEDEDFARRVYAYIRGLRGPRKHPVTCREIDDHFSEYSRSAVSEALNTLILDGRVRIMMRSISSGRRANGGYCYEAVPTESVPWVTLEPGVTTDKQQCGRCGQWCSRYRNTCPTCSEGNR